MRRPPHAHSMKPEPSPRGAAPWPRIPAARPWWPVWQRKHARTAAGCFLLQLLVLIAVYQAHELTVTPGIEAAAAEAAAGSVGTGGGAVQEHRPAAAKRQAARHAHRSGGGRGSTRSGNTTAGCGVVLADADRELLSREIDAIMRSLSDSAPWAVEQAEAGRRDANVRAGEGLPVQTTKASLHRLADEPWGRVGASNTPGTQDVHAELQAYGDSLVRAMVADAAAAAKRQARPRAADLGLAPWDDFSELASLPARAAFLNQLHEEVSAREAVRVCVATTTSADVWGVRRELLPWMQYHTELGVTRFYILYDGHDPEAVRWLSQIHGVTLLHIHAPYASAAQQAEWELYRQQAARRALAAAPTGNYQLMAKQGYCEHLALRKAAEAGMHWLLHIDADELLHPGGPAFSITEALKRVPASQPAIRFMNFEGQPEAGDLVNRYEQVTLFKAHKHWISPEALYYRPKYKLGDSPAFLMLYANGKAAVRVDAPGARPRGPHFFTGDPSPRWQTEANPRGEWADLVSDDTVVLHYAYSYLSDVSSKAHRSCPDDYLEAARRGDRQKISECLVLELDQDAYIAAANGRAAVEDLFYSRFVLSEGSRVRCTDPKAGLEGWCTLTDIGRFKHLMEKVGLLRRLPAPQLLLRQHERAIRALIRQRGGRSS